MEQAEKKTEEEILYQVASMKERMHGYERDTVIKAIKTYHDQFKSPPVIDEKEIEPCPVCTEVPNERFQRQYNTIHKAHEALNEVGVPPQDTLALRIKHLIKFTNSLSSERAMELEYYKAEFEANKDKVHTKEELMEFAEWTSKEGWIFNTDHWLHVFNRQTKSTSQLMEMFRNRE